VYLIDLPFLVSKISDPSRYLWFDWQSRWSSIEIEPSSISRYSLAGVPYITKMYEYSTNVGEDINDSENYFIRLSRARKNYLTNWASIPYFYSRTTNWNQITELSENLYKEPNIDTLKSLLSTTLIYWNSKSYLNLENNKLTPSISGIALPGRSS